MNISGAAAGGLQQAQAAFGVAAQKVSAAAEFGYSADISTNVVDLIRSKNEFSADIAVLKAADSMERTTLTAWG